MKNIFKNLFNRIIKKVTSPKENSCQSADVKVYWVSQGEGGRPLPITHQCRSVGFFENDQAWSVIFDFKISPHEQGLVSNAKAHFLMEYVPSHFLEEGAEFSIYEGGKRIADVVVIHQR